MGAGAEIPADQQRFPQLAQVVPGGIRNGVQPPLGDVHPQALELAQPQITRQRVGDQQPGQQARPAMAAGPGRPRPALPFQHQGVEDQEHRHQAQVIVQVAQVDNPARNGLEARPGTQLPQPLRGLDPEKVGDGAGTQQVEHPTQGRGADQADDLVVTARRHEQAHAEVGRPQQESRQVTGTHGPPVQVPQQRHSDRQRQRDQQRHKQQAQAGEELAEDKVPQRHGLGVHVFQGAGAALLAPHAHRQRAGQEYQEDGHPLEQRPHIGDVAGKEGRAPEEHEQGHRREGRQKQVGDRRGKKDGGFLGGNTQHGSPGPVITRHRPPPADPQPRAGYSGAPR